MPPGLPGVVAIQLDVVDVPGLQHLLDPSEKEQAQRFRFERDAARYRAAHIALRVVLADAVGCDPAHLVLAVGAHGKPRLAATAVTGCAPLPANPRFNLSHSGGRALVAWSDCCEVGVDIECLRSLPDHEALAAAHFTDEERRELRALPADLRARAFFVAWTRKEAALKAVGIGLHVEPRRVHVGTSALAGWSKVPHPDEADSARTARVALQPLDVGAQAVAHVAWVAPPPHQGMTHR
jgi:4'-phosphopantetheinyl transferase